MGTSSPGSELVGTSGHVNGLVGTFWAQCISGHKLAHMWVSGRDGKSTHFAYSNRSVDTNLNFLT